MHPSAVGRGRRIDRADVRETTGESTRTGARAGFRDQGWRSIQTVCLAVMTDLLKVRRGCPCHRVLEPNDEAPSIGAGKAGSSAGG